jgi:hydroxypyruvate isomerase
MAGGLTLSPCVEWLFADGGRPFAERVCAAATAGFGQIEFWAASNKDIGQVEEALRETGVAVTCFVSEPAGRLADPETHAEFLEGVERSAQLATRLETRSLIIVTGDTLPRVSRMRQRDAITQALVRAAPIASAAGVQLVLEPLNTRVDHPGYFLDSTAEGLDIVREVNHPSMRLLYDLYHSMAMGEEPEHVLAGSGHLVGHVHIADVPGRHEPGTGRIDWPRQLAALRKAGYSGAIGLEYMPTRDTESSLELIRRLTA